MENALGQYVNERETERETGKRERERGGGGGGGGVCMSGGDSGKVSISAST